MSNELRNINSLFPPFAEQVYKFDKEAKEKYNFNVFETLRPIEKQRENWAKGRQLQPDGTWKVVDSKLVVTNAKPGLSFHGFGLAFDDVPDGNPNKEGVQWSWDDNDLTKPGKQNIPWPLVAVLGKAYGFEWAGDWRTFPEMPHFQRSYGFRAQELLVIFTHDGLDGVWKAIERSIAKTTNSAPMPYVPGVGSMPGYVPEEYKEKVSNNTSVEAVKMVNSAGLMDLKTTGKGNNIQFVSYSFPSSKPTFDVPTKSMSILGRIKSLFGK